MCVCVCVCLRILGIILCCTYNCTPCRVKGMLTQRFPKP